MLRYAQQLPFMPSLLRIISIEAPTAASASDVTCKTSGPLCCSDIPLLVLLSDPMHPAVLQHQSQSSGAAGQHGWRVELSRKGERGPGGPRGNDRGGDRGGYGRGPPASRELRYNLPQDGHAHPAMTVIC